MPPKMADHSVQARKRMRTSLKLEEKGAGVQPLDTAEEPPAAAQLDPEAVSNALRALAERFAAKPAETPQQAGVTQLMSQFSPNTGQPAPSGPVDNTGQKDDQRIRQAVQQAMKEKA